MIRARQRVELRRKSIYFTSNGMTPLRASLVNI